MIDWKPISEAPKDGRDVLLIRNGPRPQEWGRPVVCYWNGRFWHERPDIRRCDEFTHFAHLSPPKE